MQKAIDLVKKISKDIDKNWFPELEEINLHKLFQPIFKMQEMNLPNINITICFIIFAYDNDSNWLNLKQDRLDNKTKILKSLGRDTTSELFSKIVSNDNQIVNGVIAEYLVEQTTWKWQTCLSLLDYHSKMIRFANQKTETEKTFNETDKDGKINTLTEEYEIDKITKVNKEKGLLLEQAIQARERADKLLGEMRKEFVALEHSVQQDFSFSITDEKKIDPMSWKQHIERRNERKKQLTL